MEIPLDVLHSCRLFTLMHITVASVSLTISGSWMDTVLPDWMK
jgi:hypothetical protein